MSPDQHVARRWKKLLGGEVNIWSQESKEKLCLGVLCIVCGWGWQRRNRQGLIVGGDWVRAGRRKVGNTAGPDRRYYHIASCLSRCGDDLQQVFNILLYHRLSTTRGSTSESSSALLPKYQHSLFFYVTINISLNYLLLSFPAALMHLQRCIRLSPCIPHMTISQQ